MSTPIQRLMQMLPQIAQIRNQREQLGMERERLDLTKETQEIQNALLKANTITNFAQQSINIAQPARQALAENFAELSRVLPAEALTKIMEGMPESAAISGARTAQDQYERMKPLGSRIKEQLEQIPDAQVRDIAINSATREFAGMDAAGARQSATVADRAAVPDDQMQLAVKQQLRLVMTPQEVKEFEQNSERLLQGWEGLKNQKDIAAGQLHLGMLELSARTMGGGGGGAGGAAGMISPMKAIENINSMINQLNDRAQTPMTRTMMGNMIRTNLIALAAAAEAGGDLEGAQMWRALTNEDLSKTGAAGVMGALTAWLVGGGGKKLKMAPIATPSAQQDSTMLQMPGMVGFPPME